MSNDEFVDYETEITEMVAAAVPMLACFQSGASAFVKATGTVVRIERVYCLARVQETYKIRKDGKLEDLASEFIVPVVDSNDGLMGLATQEEGYIGFFEAPTRFEDDLPMTIDLGSQLEANALMRRVKSLLARHNARKQAEDPDDAQVLRLASRRTAPNVAPTEPAPPPGPQTNQQGETADD